MVKSKKGFTLVEILITTAIVGLLASVAITNFMRAQTEAAAVSVTESIGRVFRAVEVVFVTYGDVTAELLEENGIAPAETIGPYRRTFIAAVNPVTNVPYADIYIRNKNGNLIALITGNMIDAVPVYASVSSYPETACLIELWQKNNFKLVIV